MSLSACLLFSELKSVKVLVIPSRQRYVVSGSLYWTMSWLYVAYTKYKENMDVGLGARLGGCTIYLN